MAAKRLIERTDLHKNIPEADHGGARSDETAPDEIVQTERPRFVRWGHNVGAAEAGKMKCMTAGKPSIPAIGVDLPEELAGKPDIVGIEKGHGPIRRGGNP